MIDWKKKLSSRKFWVAIAGLLAGIFVFMQDPTINNLSGAVLMVGSVVAYVLSEGWIDAASVSSNTTHAEVSGASAKTIVEAAMQNDGSGTKEKTEPK